VNAPLARPIVSRPREDAQVLMFAVSSGVMERRGRGDGEPVSGQLGADGPFVSRVAVASDHR
jgi:hypothetical protein